MAINVKQKVALVKYICFPPAGASLQEIVEALALEFDVTRVVLERDIGSLLERLVRSGVVMEPRPAELPQTPNEPSVVRCALTLAGATATLRVLGLRRVLAMARRTGRRRVPPTNPPTHEFLDKVFRKVDLVAAFFPGRALCLERSLALYILLRRSGVPARLRIGVHPYPFAAHAWVEYEGAPVGDSRDNVGRFVPFQNLGV